MTRLMPAVLGVALLALAGPVLEEPFNQATDRAGQWPVAAPRERGAAEVDFVLAGGLLTLFFWRSSSSPWSSTSGNSLIDSAASGARYGTLADRSAADARARTAQLISVALSPGFASEVSTTETYIKASPRWR